MGEPQIQQLCCCQCPSLCAIAPVHINSLKLTLHAFPLARIHSREDKKKKKRSTGPKITETCPQPSTADEFADWLSHTYSWLSPGKTSRLQQIPPCPWSLSLQPDNRLTFLRASHPGDREYSLHACRTNKAVKYTILQKN